MNEEPIEEVKKDTPVQSGVEESVKEEQEEGNNMFLIILIIGVVLVVVGTLMVYFLGISRKDEISIEDLTITQPFVEYNEFKTFTLSNGLRVLLSKTNDGMENSFVSLTVGVGSQTDPEDFCGFTHLIEHLLFTGSRSYPEDDYIVKVINKYNGEDNGVTKSFTTSYYYKVGQGGLPEFSAVLADAVAFPNFDANKIQKELNNVNSEISMRMTFNKNLGYYKMIKKIGNPDARIFRDGFANIDSSKQDFDKLHEYISAFHKKYYSANIMTLAIITNEDLDMVEKIVKKEFNIIPNKQVIRPTHEHEEPYQPPFLPYVFGNIFYLQGFSKPAQLSLVFEVNSERKYYRFHALEFFSFFLNYYSAGSLKDKLIRQGLITGFDDELTLQDYRRGVYMVQFDLTKAGETKIAQIMIEFFKFVEFVKNLDVAEKIYNEGSNFSKYAFLFNISSEFLMFPEVEQDNFQRVLDFSEKMQDVPNYAIFTANQTWGLFNPSRFKNIFNDLNPEKMIIMLESEDFELVEDDQLLHYDINWINGVDTQHKQVNDSAHHFEQELKTEEAVKQSNRLRRLEEIAKLSPKDRKIRQLMEQHRKRVKASKIKNEQMTKKDTENVGESENKPVMDSGMEEDTQGEVMDKGDRDVESIDEGDDKKKTKKEYEPVLASKDDFMVEENFFDNVIEYVKLIYALDFDNNKKFCFEPIPGTVMKKLKKNIEEGEKDFDPINTLNVEDTMAYDMITNCTLPDDLGNDMGPVDNIKRQNVDPTSNKNPIEERSQQHQLKIANKQYENTLNLVRIYDVLFNDSLEEHVLTQKMLIIRSLLEYKICLINEFDKDDEEIKAEILEDTPRLKSYYKIYRKTLQPKSAVRVMIENPYFQENIIKGSAESKQKFYLRVELLCLYIKHYLTLNFYKEFIGGSDLSVSSHSYAIYFTFIGLSPRVKSFVETMLSETEKLLDPSNYDMSILENLQARIINNYSNYSSMTSLKVSTYLLDLMIDELTMDIRTEDNLEQIRKWVEEITPQDLADTLSRIQSQNKLTILQAGNLNKSKAKQQKEIVKKYLLKDENQGDGKPGRLFSESINKVLDNMLLRFGGQNHHYMVRVPNLDPEDNNSVYVTYFRSEKETVKVKFIGTMVSHWMRAFVFDRLRNQKNLGYVAYESIREYYYRTGQMILIQGEKFRPTEIEGDIEDTIRDFFEELKAKTTEEVEGLKKMILQNYTEFTNSLEDVTGKLWDFIEEEYILEEEQDYETIAKQISLQDMVDYYQSTFYDNQRRITLQLFAHELKEEEKNFKLEEGKRLVNLDYQFKSIDEMIQMRQNSVQTFKRELRNLKDAN
jgi:secreted Zn-dependent insulinase-like peptidase